MLTSETDFL